MYIIQISKSTRTINSLLIKGPKLWNLLPTNIQNIKNENLFKKRVKICYSMMNYIIDILKN